MTLPGGGYFGEVANGKKYRMIIWFTAKGMGTFGKELELDLTERFGRHLAGEKLDDRTKQKTEPSPSRKEN